MKTGLPTSGKCLFLCHWPENCCFFFLYAMVKKSPTSLAANIKGNLTYKTRDIRTHTTITYTSIEKYSQITIRSLSLI